jgi:hypothetical protein
MTISVIETTKCLRISCFLIGSPIIVSFSGCADDVATQQSAQSLKETIAFDEAKLLIEHNATDEDTGFQAFVDGEPWNDLDIMDLNGKSILKVKGQGKLAELGLAELFFETNEPSNQDVAIGDLLANLPAGQYKFGGKSVDGAGMEATATLTHDIPAAPVIMSPLEDAVVDANNLVISWNPVTESLTGTDITIAAYQLIVEKEMESHPHAFANVALSVHVSPSVTSITVPPEFLEPGTSYEFEVFAIEESGNQTISESAFETP